MNREILKLAVPSILATITVPLVGMVDVAIAGRLGSESMIAAIAIGTMFFDLIYWNMGFLRAGTAGLTAQAYGRNDSKEMIRYFVQGAVTALGMALLILLIQGIFIELAFHLVRTSAQSEAYVKEYFFIRIWAAPATLMLFVFRGWFLGMQNTIYTMILDIWVNVVNLVASVLLAFNAGLGIAGIAYGTLVAQYSGLILAIRLFTKYRHLFKYISLKASAKLKDLKKFFSVNRDLFIRSICFLCVYTGFTSLSSQYGDTLVAVSNIMMKIALLYSYLVDGFAYAAEAIVGKYVGAQDENSLKKAVRLLFVWCLSIAAVSTVVYVTSDEWLIRLMTNNEDVINAARPFFGWLYIIPLISCIAFTWDGIYIGATASKAVRNCMILSATTFFLGYFLTVKFIGPQALWVGFCAHLVVRSIYMTVAAKRNIFKEGVRSDI